MDRVARGRGRPILLIAVLLLLAGAPDASPWTAAARAHGTRVAVASGDLRVMDGDTAEIRWSAADVETVRVLGIDTPELFRGWALDPRGAEARGFARGAFATAGRIELLRCGAQDRYRRTLGYFFLDGRNYSVLALAAGMARETISRFGDNGLVDEAREVLEAARRAGAPRRRSPGRGR